MSTTPLTRASRPPLWWAPFAASVTGWVTAAASAALLLRWWIVPPDARQADAGLAIEPAAALGLVLLGVAAALVTRARPELPARQLANMLVGAAALLGIIAIGGRIIGADPNLDRLLVGGSPPQMALATAIALVFLAVALVLIDVDTLRRARRPASVLSLLVMATTILALTGHLYRAVDLPSSGPGILMPPTTAVLLLALGLSILVARPDRGPAAVIAADDLGGVILRRVLPAAVLGPIILGYLGLVGVEGEIFAAEFGLGLMVLATITITSVVAWRVASRLGPIDRERRELNQNLQVIVEQRTAELSATERLLRSSINALLDGFVRAEGVRNADGRIVDFQLAYVNQAARRLFLRSPDLMLEGRLLSSVMPGDEDHIFIRSLARVVRTGEPMEHVLERPATDDLPDRYTELRAVKAEEGVSITIRDITEQRRTTHELAEARARFTTAFAEAPIGMALIGLDGRVQDANVAMAELFGNFAEALINNGSAVELVHPHDQPAMQAALDRLFRGEDETVRLEVRVITSDRGEAWVRASLAAVRDETEKPSYLLMQFEDITERRAAEEVLAHQASHDPLTGLPNRVLMKEHLTAALGRARRRSGTLAVLFVDLDGFKPVNDAFGHQAGDVLLCEVTKRLVAAVRPGDVVSRLGGDEFVVVAEHIEGRPAAQSLAVRLALAVKEPYVLREGVARVTASVGIAMDTDGVTAEALVAAADTSMYEEKASKR